jgi:ribosomal protein S18 acetylase RimI-like enzyme
METRRVRPSELPAVFSLLSENGWAHRLSDFPAFVALVDASPVADVAVVQQQVVGFVRGITDGLSNGYLSMVVVAPSHRGKGIGTALVRHAIGDDPRITWVLRAGRDGAAEFFARLGFEVSSIAMERMRT